MTVRPGDPGGTPVGIRRRDAFIQLYRARYGDVLAMACALLADFTEAQDVAQEAFSRAWQRWASISDRDEPIAWVKRVAVNLAMSRLRRQRVVRRFLQRQRQPVVPPVSEDHVMLVTELRRLPVTVMQAMVLFYVGDLSVEEIADAMHTRPGTVKSWLHRGRAALSSRLSSEETSA